MQNSTCANDDLSVRRKRARWQVPKSESRVPDFDFMTGIWSPNSNKKIIFAAEVGRDLAFPLTPVLAAYENIDEAKTFTTVTANVACNTHEHVFGTAPVRANNHISQL